MPWKQDWYTPRHPEKYVGDVNRIRYMSSWELKMHQFLDNNPNVLEWCSECIAIPYVKPTDGKVHKYYPDYWVKYRNKKGEVVQEIVEVKPEEQTRQTRKRNRKQRLYEQLSFEINKAKWRFAQQFCNKYGLKFRIVTEKGIYR